MSIRLPIAFAMSLLASGTATAAIDCPLERASYRERQNGYELRFRPAEPWEMTGNTKAIYDLAFPDGETVLWGYITSNMGTSRDEGFLFSPDCRRPGAEDPGSTEEELAECQVWNNVVYEHLADDVEFIPLYDEPAVERLLFTDLGRAVRYSLYVLGPGDEPWDVFTFKACAD